MSIEQLLEIQKECEDNFESEGGEENIYDWAESVPGLIDEVIRLRGLLANTHDKTVEKYPHLTMLYPNLKGK